MKKLFILVTLILSACSTFETPRYSVTEYTNSAIVARDIKDVNIGDFTGYAFYNAGCKFKGPVATSDDLTFSKYIQRAFVAEFISAHAFNPASPTTLYGRINKLKFASSAGNATGSWDIEITLKSSNGNSRLFTEHYVFPSDLNDATACALTAKAFASATQSLIANIIETPEFMLLVNNKPDKQDFVLAVANSTLFTHRNFLSTLYNDNRELISYW